MKPHLSVLDCVVWASAAALHAILGLIIRLSGVHRRLPFFTTQIYLCLTCNIVCYFLYRSAFLTAYTFVNYSTELIVDGLYGLFLWREVYLTTFGPPSSLPDWVPPRFLLYVGGLYVAVLVTGAMLPPPWMRPVVVAMVFLAHSLRGILAAVCIVLIVYSFRLGISWSRSILMLTSGLAFSVVAQLAAAYSRHFVLPRHIVILYQISSVAYLITLLVWLLAVLMEKVEIETETATPEMVGELRKQMDNIAGIADAWILHKESNR